MNDVTDLRQDTLLSLYIAAAAGNVSLIHQVLEIVPGTGTQCFDTGTQRYVV